MKRMSVAWVMCLMASSLLASPMERVWAPDDKKYSDPVKLKLYLETNALVYGQFSESEMVNFKQAFSIKDETLRALLMGFIREDSAKTGWKWRLGFDEPREIAIASMRLREAIKWMHLCADTETKRFLMGIITDNTIDDEFRNCATNSYMKVADAQEKWDALARFLSGELKTTYIYGKYLHAMQLYDEVKEDPQRRDTIVATVSIALAKEADKFVLAKIDKLLAERSKEYAESAQRKAALQRFNLQPEKDTQ